jgi:glycosyltransferase involved in cell wall biosynthesis
MFQGLLRYLPNVDAAFFLARDILPALKARLGDVRIRLVGPPSDRVKKLETLPEVTVTGWVPQIDDELAVADLVLVPLRVGSGTRIKILEAFAHRVPVVSTTLGAEGLDVVGGRHLLLADTASTLADACERVVTDPERRSLLIDEAERLFLERYDWSRVHESIAELAERVAKSGR